MINAVVIFGEDAKSEPDFMNRMNESFNNIPLLAKQLEFPLSDFEQEAFQKNSNTKRQPRAPRPKLVPQIGQQFRVEVWRDSKKEKRRVRVIEL